MKVLIVSDARSVHTQRWLSSLKEKGIDTVLYSINMFDGDFYKSRGIKCHYFDLFRYQREKKGLLHGVISHYRAVKHLKHIIKIEMPDILHAHFATSYALVAALAGFHPFIVSVWGSDIYLYPKKSRLNRAVVEYSLHKADKILSTSNVMAKECRKYTGKPIEITPFGVDASLFRRACGGEKEISLHENNDSQATASRKFTIGSVKSLSANYGTEYLLRAFEIVARNNPSLDCRLELVGKGPDEAKLKALAQQLGLSNKVIFRGFVEQQKLPEIYSKFTIACYLSISESFGVSAIEAMACNCPVVASDAEGFTEVIEDGITGIIVPKCNPEAAAQAIQRFIDNPSDIEKMGSAARERVCNLYVWENNVNTMISIYRSVL